MSMSAPLTAARLKDFFRFAPGSLLSDLLETRCLLCSALMPFPQGRNFRICSSCLTRLKPRKLASCPRCGNIFPSIDMAGELCGQCALEPPPWSRILYYGLYEGYTRELIHQMKFGGRLAVARGLGELTAELVCSSWGRAEHDLIIPIPLHRWRLRKRGFNQALELARPLARRLDCDLKRFILVRQVHTQAQSGLTRRERQENVRDVFSCTRSLYQMKILLFDDVMTTGATMHWACRSLLESGAKSVDVVVVARTPSKSAMSPDKAERKE